jgi:hypothetical protein
LGEDSIFLVEEHSRLTDNLASQNDPLSTEAG